MISTYQNTLLVLERVKKFLDNNNYTYKIDNTGISVFNNHKSAKEIYYSAFELFLIDECSKKLGGELKFSFITDDNGKRFTITSTAKYDFKKYLSELNKKLRAISSKIVYIGENDPSSSAAMCVYTMEHTGTWIKVQYTKTEILLCAMNMWEPKETTTGYYEYSEIKYLQDSYNKELQQIEQ